MILRIFATDGFTPERIFRWSVEETAEHLCAQQVLWVTRLDGPWKPLIEWFLKQSCCRSVVLDTADRWEWDLEHEITWRIAQGLYFQEEPEAVCWIHDDMAPPECRGFKDYFQAWLGSESNTIAAPCYQLWNDFDSIRVDKIGVDLAGDMHCWLAKWQHDLAWVRPNVQAPQLGNEPQSFVPLNAVQPWVSLWPFRHAKGVDRDFREHNGFIRRGFPTERWRNADGVKCVPYSPDVKWEEFIKDVMV